MLKPNDASKGEGHYPNLGEAQQSYENDIVGL